MVVGGMLHLKLQKYTEEVVCENQTWLKRRTQLNELNSCCNKNFKSWKGEIYQKENLGCESSEANIE